MSTGPSSTPPRGVPALKVTIVPSGTEVAVTRVARLLARIVFRRLRAEAEETSGAAAAHKGGSRP